MTLVDDLRGFIKGVDKLGELKQLDGVDWDQEMGCISEINKGDNAPAILFDNIKDYPQGYRVMCSSLSSRDSVSLAFNLAGISSDMELLEAIRQKLPDWESQARDFPPKVVKTGSILENVHSGKDIDLFEFPVPKWHEMDGGRYIGTGDVVVTRDPDSGEVNLGTYRIMVHDKKTTALYISPGQHGRVNCEKWHQRGKACPVAISVGQHPLLVTVAARPIRGPEYNFLGAIRGKPVKVIKEEVTGLPIPADSEIVIAGWCPPGKTKLEGPFGEWTGYYASKDRPAPIIEVERIYHRNDPIILGMPPSRPPSGNSYWGKLFSAALIYNDLVRNGVTDVKGVWLSAAGNRTFITVSIKQRYPGHAKRAALLACQSRVGAYLGRYVVVVDDDIDPSNINDVIWAMCFRSDPEKDIDIVRHAWSGPLDPMIRKPATAYFNSRAIIDACKPYDWIEEFPKEIKSNPKVVEKVKKKWGKTLGL